MNLLFSIPNQNQLEKWKISILSLFLFSRVKEIKLFFIISDPAIEKSIVKIIKNFNLNYSFTIFNLKSKNKLRKDKLILEHFYENGMISWLLSPYVFDEDNIIICDNDLVYFTDLTIIEKSFKKFQKSDKFLKGRRITNDHYFVKKNSDRFFRDGYYDEIRNNLISTGFAFVNLNNIRNNFSLQSFNFILDTWFKNAKSVVTKWYSDEAVVNTLFNKKIDSTLGLNFNLTFQYSPERIGKLITDEFMRNGFIYHYFVKTEWRDAGINADSLLLSSANDYELAMIKVKDNFKRRDLNNYKSAFNKFKIITDFSRSLSKSKKQSEIYKIKEKLIEDIRNL